MIITPSVIIMILVRYTANRTFWKYFISVTNINADESMYAICIPPLRVHTRLRLTTVYRLIITE